MQLHPKGQTGPRAALLPGWPWGPRKAGWVVAFLHCCCAKAPGMVHLGGCPGWRNALPQGGCETSRQLLKPCRE